MKKIFKSALLVLGVAAIAGYATYSFFSDTETSNGNTFTAGSIDLSLGGDFASANIWRSAFRLVH
jgi:predicted ribosomally synthesized peptide with SipW-like signal peptide